MLCRWCYWVVLTESQESSKKDKFYDFDLDEDCSAQSTVESEVNDYLSNAKEKNTSISIPKWKNYFWSTAQLYKPSSAPVGRLFSLGSVVLSFKCNTMLDSKECC